MTPGGESGGGSAVRGRGRDSEGMRGAAGSSGEGRVTRPAWS